MERLRARLVRSEAEAAGARLAGAMETRGAEAVVGLYKFNTILH